AQRKLREGVMTIARKYQRIYTRLLTNGETRYDVSVDGLYPATGKRRQRMKTFCTLKEAKTYLAQHRVDVASQQAPRAARARLGAPNDAPGSAKIMGEDWGAVTVWANDLEKAAEWFYWAGRDHMVRVAMERLQQ